MGDDLPAIPPALAASWRRWWPRDAAAVAFDVARRMGDALRAWEVTEPEPLPGGEVALVIAGRRAGREVVVKVSPATGSEALVAEGEALSLWARHGLAPAVGGVRDGGLTLLLARVRPGRSLGDLGADAETVVETIGRLCPGLHLEVDRERFPALARHAEEEGWLTALAGRREHGELVALLVPGPGDRLLHTDLHSLNVLRSRDSFLVIDPKPHIGDPHAETFAFFDGPPALELPVERTAARAYLARLATRYAREAGLDIDRLQAWIRLRALAIVTGSPIADEPWGQRLSRLADALD